MYALKSLPAALLLSGILAVGPACNGDDGGPNGNGNGGGIAELEGFWDLTSLSAQINGTPIEFVADEGWSGFLEIGASPDEYEIVIRDELGTAIEDLGDEGDVQRSGSTLTFASAFGGSYTGTLSGSSITISAPGEYCDGAECFSNFSGAFQRR
jgi:hypothetical protein